MSLRSDVYACTWEYNGGNMREFLPPYETYRQWHTMKMYIFISANYSGYSRVFTHWSFVNPITNDVIFKHIASTHRG